MKACLFLAAFLTLSPALAAEPQCAPWPAIRQNLSVRFHEVQVGGGLINERVVLAIFASAGGATWTTIAIGIDGTACVMSAGTGWSQTTTPTAGEKPL